MVSQKKQKKRKDFWKLYSYAFMFWVGWIINSVDGDLVSWLIIWGVLFGILFIAKEKREEDLK